MSLESQKHIRDEALELNNFLNDLHNWERSVKEKDQVLRTKAKHEETSALPPVRALSTKATATKPLECVSKQGPVHELKSTNAKPIQQQTSKNKSAAATSHTYDHYRDKWDKFDVEAALQEADKDTRAGKTSLATKIGGVQSGNGKYMPTADIYNSVSPRFSTSSSDLPNAMLEKEQGNDYFKQKKYAQAIESYTRSIALQPTAIVYANRAMSYLKLRRYKECQADCTEAISLDDRYVKAYSRRGTARKELGEYEAAVEDFEFALRLEPDNKELKKQYLEAKELCEKKAGVMVVERKVPIAIQEVKAEGGTQPTPKVRMIEAVSEVRRKDSADLMEVDVTAGSEKDSASIKDIRMIDVEDRSQSSHKQHPKGGEQGFDSVNEIASRAAAKAMEALMKKISAPKTSYEFESLWKGFSGNRAAQAELLKVMNPSTIPKVFKDSINWQLLSDIILCLQAFFPDSTSHAIDILENFTKVGRFNMAVMCFSNNHKAGLRELWDKVFLAENVGMDAKNRLNVLRSKYRL